MQTLKDLCVRMSTRELAFEVAGRPEPVKLRLQTVPAWEMSLLAAADPRPEAADFSARGTPAAEAERTPAYRSALEAWWDRKCVMLVAAGADLSVPVPVAVAGVTGGGPGTEETTWSMVKGTPLSPGKPAAVNAYLGAARESLAVLDPAVLTKAAEVVRELSTLGTTLLGDASGN